MTNMYRIKVGGKYVTGYTADYIHFTNNVKFALVLTDSQITRFSKTHPYVLIEAYEAIAKPKDIVIKVGNEQVARIDPSVVSDKFSLNEKIVCQIKDGKTVTISLENR